MTHSATTSSKPRVSQKVVDHARRLPRWTKRLLVVATLLASVGVVGQVTGRLTGDTPPPASSLDGTGRVSDGMAVRGFGATGGEVSQADSERSADGFVASASPLATRIGLGFVLGFVLGFAFRIFVKTLAVVTAVGVAVLVGLSYFNVLNVDLTEARDKYETSMEWVSDQSQKFKDFALGHIPGGASTGAGLFLGFRRKT